MDPKHFNAIGFDGRANFQKGAHSHRMHNRSLLRVKLSLNAGFTLIEMSIVLVIIGLIIGAVLVGQDLISAARVRAQISQIEKYQTAVNTFKGKYGYLPGDIPNAIAIQFGFAARGSFLGEGDGNGTIQGIPTGPNNSFALGFCQAGGEPLLFWADLGQAGLIDNQLTSDAGYANTKVSTSNPATIGLYLPQAKIGNGNYVYVWEGGYNMGWSGSNETGDDNMNYFGLAAVTQFGWGAAPWAMISSPKISVQQAFTIDQKIDDGLPQSGNVMALHLSTDLAPFSPVWASSGGITGAPYTTATTGSFATCFDNNGNAGSQNYSVGQNKGSGQNCALSIKFK